ncbi:MAG: NAD-dependent deacylase, partial [Bacteroidetes bacterium]|nr:NAD-dependent deacylase [Bacteroidota bacterium]
VPNISIAASIVETADIMVVIGTSLQVYPAAGLLQYAPNNIPKYLIDPNAEPDRYMMNLTVIREKATVGVVELKKQLKS